MIYWGQALWPPMCVAGTQALEPSTKKTQTEVQLSFGVALSQLLQAFGA